MATAVRKAQLRTTSGVPILAGRLLFGLSALALFGAVVFWDALGKPWGPGASANMGYLLFALHVALVIGRVSPMDPVVWVPVSMLLFYFGLPVVIEWMGLDALGGYDPWNGGNAPYLARGYAAALMATAAFLFGVHLAGVRPLADDPRLESIRDRSLGASAVLFSLGSMVMVAAGIAIVGPRNVFGLYHEWWDAKMLGVDQRWIDIGVMFAASGVFALFASDEPSARWRRWLAYAVIPVIALIAIQKGDRTSLIALGVGAGWCYAQRVRRLSWSPVLAVAFSALVVMPVIGEWRSQRSLEESKQKTVYELLGSSLYNMGSSVNTIVYTVQLIPAEQGYSWGRTFWHAALQAIPNVGLTKGKEFVEERVEDSPSTWLTWIISPHWAATGGGYGFSMAAEWHYNFGLVGVLLGMTLVGWGMARARNAARNSSLALVWSATLFAALTIWVRNVVGYALKVAVWPIIGLWLIQRLLVLLRSRGAMRRAGLARASSSSTP